MGKYIIAFGRAWACTNHAYKEIQEILLSIYGPKTKEGVDILDKKGVVEG